MLTSALTKFFDVPAGSAGTEAWVALKSLVAKHCGSAPDELKTAREVADLAEVLVSQAELNPELARGLVEWQRSVTGCVTGTVHGNVVQARDVSGPISFN